MIEGIKSPKKALIALNTPKSALIKTGQDNFSY